MIDCWRILPREAFEDACTYVALGRGPAAGTPAVRRTTFHYADEVVDIPIKPRDGATRRSKRRGLGPASGVGGTSGRGHKGQKARTGGKVPRWFEGGQMPYQRRIPKQGFTNIHRVPYQAVNLSSLGRFAQGETVSCETLKAKRLIGYLNRPVKILGNGEIAAPPPPPCSMGPGGAGWPAGG